MPSKRVYEIRVTDNENNLIRSATLSANTIDDNMDGIGNMIETLTTIFKNDGETIEVTTRYHPQ